jgi:hypothetical protein
MSYEREAIPDSSSTPLPAQASAPVLREERVLDPYHSRIASAIGQPDIVSAEKPLEEPKVATTEESVKLSPQLAALARREQKFRAQQQQLEKDRLAISAEKEELAQLRAMKEKLAAKDYSALEGLVDYNEYSQYTVNKLNGANPMEDELKKLNGKINELEKFSKDNVTKQYEAAVAERRNAALALVDKSPDFPRIKKAKAHEAVVQHILDTWEHDNQELSVEQAAKEVEELLVEKAKQWAALLEEEKQSEPAEVDQQKKSLPPLKQGLKTLTNHVTTGGELKRPQKSLHGMSDSERWAEARRRAEEKLQNNNR